MKLIKPQHWRLLPDFIPSQIHSTPSEFQNTAPLCEALLVSSTAKARVWGLETTLYSYHMSLTWIAWGSSTLHVPLRLQGRPCEQNHTWVALFLTWQKLSKYEVERSLLWNRNSESSSKLHLYSVIGNERLRSIFSAHISRDHDLQGSGLTVVTTTYFSAECQSSKERKQNSSLSYLPKLPITAVTAG